jgi:hypothetical protein
LVVGIAKVCRFGGHRLGDSGHRSIR